MPGAPPAPAGTSPLDAAPGPDCSPHPLRAARARCLRRPPRPPRPSPLMVSPAPAPGKVVCALQLPWRSPEGLRQVSSPLARRQEDAADPAPGAIACARTRAYNRCGGGGPGRREGTVAGADQRSAGQGWGAENRLPGPAFAALVREALTHLYDPAALRRHPLLEAARRWAPGPPPSRATAPAAARALQGELLAAVEALRPDRPAGAADGALARGATGVERRYRLLTLRYVEALPVAQVQARLERQPGGVLPRAPARRRRRLRAAPRSLGPSRRRARRRAIGPGAG